MEHWKVGNRVKIEDSKIEEIVTKCLSSPNEAIKSKAQALLDYWKDRPTVFRIPRRVYVADTADDEAHGDAAGMTIVYDKPRYATQTTTETKRSVQFVPAPIVRPVIQPNRASASVAAASNTPPPSTPVRDPTLDKNRLEAILAQAQKSQEAAAMEAAAAAEMLAAQQAAAEANAAATSHKRSSQSGSSSHRRKRTKMSSEERREKKLMKLVGEFVVKTMSKYQSMMDRELFKKYAKEVSSQCHSIPVHARAQLILVSLLTPSHSVPKFSLTKKSVARHIKRASMNV